MMIFTSSNNINQVQENDNFKVYKEKPMIVNELMGNTYAKILNLPVSSLKLAQDNNNYGIIYEKEKPNLVNTKSIIPSRMPLYNFIEYIYNKYNDTELIKDIFKVIITDIAMGNPCRFAHTLLFSLNNKVTLENVSGFSFSYLTYNDQTHPPIEGLMFQEIHGDIYYQVLASLPKLLDNSPYFQELLNNYLNLDINIIKNLVEDTYHITIPSYLVDRMLIHNKEIHKLIRKNTR